MICDIDEIPDPRIDYRQIKNEIYSLEMDFYYYNLNTKCNKKWYLSKIFNYQTYLNCNKTLSEIRQLKTNSIKKGGWHLSYFGNSKTIQNKIKQNAHHEFNNDIFTNVQNINNSIKNCKDLLRKGRMELFFNKIMLMDNNNLPINFNYLIHNENICN